MKSYSEWVKESNPGNYVSIDVKELPFQLLGEDAIKCTEPHITLIYSKDSAVPMSTLQTLVDKAKVTEPATVTGVNLFPDSKSPGNNAVVLELDQPDLHNIHESLCAAGCKHSFTPFKLHTTMYYGVPNANAQEMADKLKDKVVGMKLELGKFNVNPVISDWADTLNKV